MGRGVGSSGSSSSSSSSSSCRDRFIASGITTFITVTITITITITNAIAIAIAITINKQTRAISVGLCSIGCGMCPVCGTFTAVAIAGHVVHNDVIGTHTITRRHPAIGCRWRSFITWSVRARGIVVVVPKVGRREMLALG